MAKIQPKVEKVSKEAEDVFVEEVEDVFVEEAVATQEIAEEVADSFVEEKQGLKDLYPGEVPLHILNSLA